MDDARLTLSTKRKQKYQNGNIHKKAKSSNDRDFPLLVGTVLNLLNRFCKFGNNSAQKVTLYYRRTLPVGSWLKARQVDLNLLVVLSTYTVRTLVLFMP